MTQSLNECLQFSLTEKIRDSSQRGRPKMLKAVIKHSSDADKVKHRTLPLDHVATSVTKLAENYMEACILLSH